uniref:Uncharacterized protein n=1 Tax=Candidatus Kentrum sp. TC TaxID=2126339 RepID=A0A450YM44_9GAMM|nr:MAG: hypothetical protein BECKTC1821E_GA0114239_10206 [Candidatus Kentron sp. TC]
MDGYALSCSHFEGISAMIAIPFDTQECCRISDGPWDPGTPGQVPWQGAPSRQAGVRDLKMELKTEYRGHPGRTECIPLALRIVDWARCGDSVQALDKSNRPLCMLHGIRVLGYVFLTTATPGLFSSLALRRLDAYPLPASNQYPENPKPRSGFGSVSRMVFIRLASIHCRARHASMPRE